MCGRYSLTTQREDLARALDLPLDAVLDPLAPRYNIAPTQPVPVLVNDGGTRMVLRRWGLVPDWARDPAIGNRLINARRETLADKPSFRDSFLRKRCLVIADGFYEWHEARKGNPKVPYYIRMRDHSPFTFAGLWSRWRARDGEDLLTCAIVTGEPNELVRSVHDRMPVILPAERRNAWLDPELRDERKLAALLDTLDAGAMEMTPVSRHVNSPEHDDPECIRPVEEPE